MALLALSTAGAAVLGLEHFYGPIGWVGMLAAVGGIGGSVLLAAALMGLAFLSAGTGHDEAVDDFDR